MYERMIGSKSESTVGHLIVRCRAPQTSDVTYWNRDGIRKLQIQSEQILIKLMFEIDI